MKTKKELVECPHLFECHNKHRQAANVFHNERAMQVGQSACGQTLGDLEMPYLRAVRIGLLAVAATLAGCQASEPEQNPVASQLAPMPKPVAQVGDTWKAVKDGEPYEETLIAFSGDLGTYHNSDGCEWTEAVWAFAPSLKWSDCPPFWDGTQTIQSTSGELWPLSVGNSVSYDLIGSRPGGDSWSGTRRCTVESETQVATAAGAYDTFKVVCDDPWTKRTYFVSPELNEVVSIVRYRKRQNETTTWEISPPPAS